MNVKRAVKKSEIGLWPAVAEGRYLTLHAWWVALEVPICTARIPLAMTAEDGEKGCEMAAAERPDIILMDLEMPVVDGWEATRRLKGNPQTREIPIIALSAHALAGERDKALAAGCDEFDTKPIEFDRLVATVRRILADRK
jgi:two-component system cell cycle response regulator DivK